uniref:Nephrin n=1 Tax=Steinernema glaseri TaxID=37863 RepID=A0A1I7Z3V2_9BILA
MLWGNHDHSPSHSSLALICFFGLICCVTCSQLKEAPQNKSVVIGSDVLFQCTAPPSVSGNPLKSQWRTNAGTLLGHHEPGVLAGYDGRYSYEKETPDELNLKIRRVSLEDDGKFECQMLRSGEGSMRGAAYLDVLVKPSTVYFMHYRQGDVIEVSEDQALNVTCVVPNVKPKPHMEWYINGKLIVDNNSNWEKYNLNKTVTSYSSLYWKPSRHDHRKVLTCQAEHSQTSTSLRTSVSLSVLYSSDRPRISVVGGTENVRAGQNVTLFCSVVGGNPLPNVTWHFNRHYIESPSYYDSATQETVNRYSFIADSKDNGAEYECRSQNRHNIAPLRGSVRLKVSYPAMGVDVYGDSSIRRGDRVTITCRTKPSNPASRIYFSVNGSPSPDPEQYEEVVTNGFVTIANFSLDFRDELVKNHEIVVDCAARNSEGTATKQHVIRVLSQPLQPLVYGFEHGPMLEGERLNLTCESHGGNPLAVLSWFRGIEKMKETRSTVTGDVSQSYISIVLDRSLNRAPIRCEAMNDALDHPLVASKKAVVLFPPKKVTIRPLQGEQIVAGSTAKLACITTSSNPESSIEWNFNGKDVRWRSETVQNSSNGEHHGFEVENIIVFEASEDLDSSVITCTASHPHWTKPTSASYTVNVLYPPKIAADGPISVVIGEGEQFRENLTVFANPPVSNWKWRRNGIHFQHAIGSIIANGPVLTGRSVARHDAGIYTVFASNQIGSSNATIRLSVEFPAHVTHITQPVYATTGEDVELECVVEAFPRKKGMVRWLKADKELPSVIRDERRAALRVNASEETSGEYICVADNGLGTPQMNKTYLLVNKAPTIIRQPQFSRAAATPGGKAKVICRADAVPDCKFVWKLENQETNIESNSTKYSFYSHRIAMSTYESVLWISEVNSHDYVKRIRCIAANRYGQDDIFIPLGPLTTPDLPFEIGVVNSTDESITLSWIPGFNGGSPQVFEVRYRVVGSDSEYHSVNTSEATLTVHGLSPGCTILMQLRSVNRHGSSEFSEPLRAVTSASIGLNVASVGEEDEYPKFVMILFGVGLLILLIVNCLLLAYLHRKQKLKKIQEKTEIVRTHHGGEEGVRHVQMYGTMALTPQEITRHTESDMASRCEQHLNEHCGSEDDHSVRTMIEVNPNGCMQQIGTQFFDSSCLVDYEFDPALYSDIVRNGSAAMDSSYLVGPMMEECPSIDGGHDFFPDFHTARADSHLFDSPAQQPRRDASYAYQPSNIDCGTISGRSTHSLSTFLQPGGVRTTATNYSVLDGDLV